MNEKNETKNDNLITIKDPENDREIHMWDCPNYCCIAITTDQIVRETINVTYNEAYQLVTELSKLLVERFGAPSDAEMNKLMSGIIQSIADDADRNIQKEIEALKGESSERAE